MIHICIPAYNEAPTIGLVLWRLRKVFEDYPREYEVIVVDDGSTDATGETLRPYERVMPLTIIRHEERKGYSGALDTLVRAATKRTRYPRRDAMILMQGDFTDQPEHVPELVRRFEGGADVVVAEQRVIPSSAPVAVKRLRRVAPWLLRPFVKVTGVTDPFSTLRLYRIAVVRDMLLDARDDGVARGDGWAANVEMLLRASRLARRIETVTLEPRYDLRQRESRVRPLSGALELFRFGRASREQRMTPIAT